MASPASTYNYQMEFVVNTPDSTFKKSFDDSSSAYFDISTFGLKYINTLMNCDLLYFLDDDLVITSDIVLTNQESFEASTLPSFYTDNIALLNKAFNDEYTKYAHYINVSKEIANEKYMETACLLAELPFKNASVELTKSNSLKFSLLFANDKLLLVTKPLSPIEELNENEIVFSFFVNRELQLSNAATTSNLVEGFKEFLSL